MKKPRIIHVISELDIGGTERQLSLILPSLQKHFDNHVVCMMGRGPVGKELENDGIPVHYLDGTSMLNPVTPVRLWQLLRALKPQMSIGYLLYADTLNRLTGKAAQVPVIISSQRSSLVGRAYLKSIDWLTKSFVTAYTTQTEHARQQLCDTLSVPLERIHVIPNAVAMSNITSTFNPLEPIVKNKQAQVITCVSNLKPGKGHRELIAAFARIYSQHGNARLVLVGDGPLRNAVELQIGSLGMENAIHVLGSRNDVPEILRSSDIFVMPTYGEGMSNALLEAMAAGLPCITSDIPVNAEVIKDGHHGMLWKTGDQNHLVECLNTLLSDPQEADRLGRAARDKVAQQYSLAAVTRLWVKTLSGIS